MRRLILKQRDRMFNKKVVFPVVATVILAVFIWRISGILLPFVLAFVLAYFLHPCVVRLERLKYSRTVATTLIVGAFCLFIVGLFLILVPILQAQVIVFLNKVPVIAQTLWHWVEQAVAYMKQSLPQAQLAQLSQMFSANAAKVINALGNGVIGALSGGVVFFNVVSLLLITPVVLFYVLRDWRGVSQDMIALIPRSREEDVKSLWSEINRTLAGFVRGQVSVCLVLAVYYGVALSLIGLELGILVGLIAGILSFIPYFGFLTGVGLSILLGLSQGGDWVFWLMLAGVFGVGQILESYVLTPRLVGERVGLHPVWVIFALLAGGVLLGFVGILIAVPVAAVIGVLIRRGVKAYKKTAFYKGRK